jgi:SAM-dependent methyltransferase
MNDERPVPFDPHRFQAAAPHYLAGRPAYAPVLIGRVARLCGIGERDRVLDLGCGPGQLALGFAFHAGSVLAIDPEPEMLRVAASFALSAPNIRFLQASSYDLGPSLGRFRLVAIGRAFHWMDRDATLATLDGMVEAEGAIALFGDRHPEVPENAWLAGFRALVDRYADGDGERQRRRGPNWRSHEAVLLASVFGRLDRVAVIERRAVPVAQFVDRALSVSSTSRRRLGDRADELGREVLALMNGVARDGMVAEVVESTALIARRATG